MISNYAKEKGQIKLMKLFKEEDETNQMIF